MNEWKDTWHYKVRESLTEVLFYYLVRVKGMDVQQIQEIFKKIIAEYHIGGIRVFPIFGRYDLLIRVWMHPVMEHRFRIFVKKALGDRDLIPFAVAETFLKIYKRGAYPDFSGEILEKLESGPIKRVQSGKEENLRHEFIKKGFIVERGERTDHGIRFYLAVNASSVPDEVQIHMAKKITTYMNKMCKERAFSFPAVYKGIGFCTILIKGETNEYFRIKDLPEWVLKEFNEVGMEIYTETFLVWGKEPLIKEEVIGQSTFTEIQGKDLFIQSIIPEVYESKYQQAQQPVVKFLQKHIEHIKNLSRKDRQYILDVLLGYLSNNPTFISQMLFTLFVDLESYLRSNFEHYASKLGINMKDVYESQGIKKESKKHTPLGDILKVLNEINTRCGKSDLIIESPEKLDEQRNKVAHGVFEPLKEWDSALELLIYFKPNIKNLLNGIKEVTSNEYTGKY